MLGVDRAPKEGQNMYRTLLCLAFLLSATSTVKIGTAVAQNSAAQKILADCQTGDRTPDLAIKACTALLKNDNGIPAFGDVYYNRGYAYGKKEQYDLAIADYNEALKRKPDFARAYISRGYAFEEKKQHDDAISDFDQGLKLSPRSEFGLAMRAKAYRNKGQYQRAIQDYDAALALEPKSAADFLGRGTTKILMGDKIGGEADIAHAKELDPFIHSLLSQ